MKEGEIDDEGFIQGPPIDEVRAAPKGPIPSHIGLIELEVQFHETDVGTAEEWRLFLRARAKELHERLDAEGGPWERHTVGVKLLELTVPTEIVREIEAAETEKPFPVDGRPRIVH